MHRHCQAHRIWKLRKARLLHTHPLFEVAKSWRRTERDAFGVVHRINQSAPRVVAFFLVPLRTSTMMRRSPRAVWAASATY